MRMRRPHPPLIPAVAVVVAIIPCWLLIIVTAATTTTTGSGHSKGPLRDGEGSVKDDIKDFKFTQPSYNATVPENSLGSTLILPYTGEQIFTGGKNPSSSSTGPQLKMGVWNPTKRPVHYSITSGDTYSMFRSESLQIGDFNFLILRVRNNDRILNREFKEWYKLGVKADLLDHHHPKQYFNNASLAKAFPLVGSSSDLLFEEEGEHETEPPPDQSQPQPPPATKMFIISEEVLLPPPDKSSPFGDDTSLRDPFSLVQDANSVGVSGGKNKKNNSKVSRRTTKQKRDDDVNSDDIFSGGGGRRGGRGRKRNGSSRIESETDSFDTTLFPPLRRTLRDEKLKKTSFTPSNVTRSGGGKPNRVRGGSGGGGAGRRRNKNRPSSSQEINEINVDVDMVKSVTVRTTSNNVPSYNKRVTTTMTTTPTTTTTTTKRPKMMVAQQQDKNGGIILTSAETTVFVRVIDVDDNQPVFESQTYDIGVNEDAPILSKVAKISAADADIGRNSEIYYSLSEWSNSWSIDPITGILSPTRPLLGRTGKGDRDRETIHIRAKNRWNMTPTSGSIAAVNIHIRPVNRYAPQIRVNRPPQVEVRPYGVIYAVVSIRDADEGENGVVDLEIKEGDPNGIFRITPTSSRNEFYVEMSPIIATNLGKIERLHQFNLTLRATDRGSPAKSSEKELQVRVADTIWSEKGGENTAIFDKDVYEVEISETTSPPHSVVFRLNRPNSAVGLSISSGNEGDDFVLEEKSGVLYTNKWLDAETKSTYTLTIDSHDRRPASQQQRSGDYYRRRQSVAKIIVKVIDGNDNSPEWEPMPNNRSIFTVMENEAVGTKVTRIVAKDRDSGENGYVTYSIANLKPTPFTIDHFSGDIRTGRLLDYEIDRREFSLKIRASDWGQPSRRQSEKVMTIMLKDVNDNRPLFTVKECVAIIDKGIKFETEIGRVEAIDFDREDVVMYRIVGGNEDACFGIDTTSGKIKVVCDLRDVRVPKRFLNVTATDGEYYSDVMSIKVELGGEGRMTHLKVNRTTPPSENGSSSSSSSPRSGIKLFSTANSVFECEDTGVRERFDQMAALSEKNNQFEDGEEGFPPLPSRYRDNVHTPQWIDVPKEISVFENTSVGVTVLKLRARDLDKGYNGLLTFVISSGDEAHGAWDIVNPTGSQDSDEGDLAHLVVAAPLDREQVSSYMLNISVWDQGKPSKVSSKLLFVKVQDSNDCRPTFTKAATKLKIGEGGALVGEQLVGLSAFDEDEEGTPNSLISYRLLSPTEDFAIDEKLGTIRLLRELDRERQDFYELLVAAEDHGVPKLSSIAVVSIQVEDVNDCAPRFESFASMSSHSSSSRIVSVLEDWPVGGVVTQVLARDDDLGLGGNVRYALVGGVGEEEDFELDEVSGVLRVKRELDYETTSIYNLTIRAHDMGTPSLSSETFIVVEVLDVLESSTSISFSEVAKETSLPETTPVGSLITRVELTPSSALEHSLVTLTLEGPSRYLFTIDETGSVRTGHTLDYETHPSHWLAILAKSVSSGKTLAKMDLFVNVTDTNECVPLTTEPAYRVYLSENTPPSHIFLKLSAFDCDPSGRLTYSLKTSTPYFDIDPTSGELETTDMVLDREKQPVHIFDVIVTDGGDPRLNSSTQIVVVLRDENDNSPRFLHKRGIHTIPELTIDLQGDQPTSGKKKMHPSDSSAGLSEEDEDEDEEDDEDSEDDDEELKWSDWNVIEEQDGMFSEGGGWKKIFQVVAFDSDEGVNGSVTYRLKYRVSTSINQVGVDGATPPHPQQAQQAVHKEDEVYSINPTTGEIFTSAPLIKSDTMLKFIVEATDGGNPAQSTETTLILRVKGINRVKSQPPQILIQDETVIQLTTKERAGYSVETIDAIDPEGEQLWYEIVSGDPSQYFIMWPESQNLILAKRIPKPMDFKLNISVSDGVNPVFVQLFVKVVDSPGESALIWSQSSYTASIPEQQTPDTTLSASPSSLLIAKVSINSTISLTPPRDKHTDSGTILYGFHNVQDSRSLQLFSIDTISGEVTVQKGVAGLFDRETIPQHILTIKARNPTNTYGFVRLVVNVEEWNDHAPIFYMADGRYSRMEVRVPETAAVGTRIAQIEAFDLDEGDSGQLSYSITFGNIGNTFRIDKDTGWLTLQRPISGSRANTEYLLTIQALDGGTPPLSSTTSVTIIPTLPNDDETLALDCRGDDESNFGRNLAPLSSLPGKSGGKQSGGRAPSNQRKTVMRVRVKENAPPGSYVTTITASNSNSASVSFELEENKSNIFWIDPSTGVILVGKGRGLLDRESKSSHEITVKATNLRGATASCRVVVDLLDENDHRPLFTTTQYDGLIREDAMPGTLVRKKPAPLTGTTSTTVLGSESSDFIETEKRPLVLESSDLDVGINALVTYSIIEEEEMRKVFHIDPSTGALVLITSLDYEKRSGYVFHVKATDGGGLTSPNVATVNVSVENVNMKRPIVLNSRVELLLPTGPDVLVGRVEARDPDGDELEFNITRGNDMDWFKIGRKSGEIRIGKMAQFPVTGSKIVLEINVGDGKHWTSSTMTITPKNIERNPTFYFTNSTFATTTMENSTKIINLISLGVVGAFMNEPLKFELLTPTPYFGVRPTSGVVYTTGEKLDREEQAEHELLVQVRGEEASRISRCFVKVKIGDKNDNSIQFLNLPYVAVVSLESKGGDTVLQVKGFDADEGENAVIRYELVRSPHGDIYELDRNTGFIRLRRKPDATGQHELIIKAYDGGVPTCTSETTVLVKVVSSDQPVFEQQFYETWIPEDAALQSTAIALMAHAHNPILYSIHGGNDHDEFAIDYQTGVLFVNSPLDYETQRTHRLTVRATDLVTSSGSSTQVLIHIRDSNDARPIFDKSIYTIRLVEGYMPPHSLLATLHAHDNDTGINSLLTYDLVPDDGPILRIPNENSSPQKKSSSSSTPTRGRLQRREIDSEDVEMDLEMEDATSNQRSSWDVTKYFMIKPNDGKIILKQMVDYERAHEYRFSVVVKDSGIPPLSSTARVVVQVVDINDSGVVFEKNVYYARISESVQRGHFVTKISAYDPDSVDHIKYSIIGHSHYHMPFDINPDAGVVRVSQPNLLLTELHFELNVSVTDGVFTSFAKLHIEIEPRNHFAPSFSSLIYEVGCPENAPDGHLIAKLNAVDPDRSIFGQVKYYIAQCDEPDLFEIDEDSGEVTLHAGNGDISLDREVKGSHTLEIVARDGGGWLGYTKLAVKVIDTNEYPPQFPVTEYRITLPAERIRSKTPILQVVAVDADTEFGIRYSIVDLPTTAFRSNSNSTTTSSPTTKRDSSYFEINPDSGEVRLRMSDQDILKFMKDKSRIDFQFWAGATDEGGLHSYIPVTVVLLPEGVPNPEIQPQNATFFVKEDAPIGSIITTFRISNIEGAKFRVVSSNEEYFQVDHNGNLLVKGRLDQDNEDKHTVVIWAESGDGTSVATSQVTIRVFQSTGRKRPPVFQSLEYQVKVAEDFPEGSLIFTVRAIDSDKGNNIKEKYSLVPSKSGQETNLFSVNQEHGWITLVNKLDYELRKEHVLHVVAADVDKPYLQTTATVTLSVINVPDCPVSFDTTHYFSSVREDVPEGTVIATVHAIDLDNSASNKNGPESSTLSSSSSSSSIVSNYLAYFIIDGNDEGHFKINDRGELSIWRGLDYEQVQKYELRIVATDGFFTDFANVTVNLMDVNDNSPVCTFPEYDAELSESVAIGTYVVTVEAHDPDLGALAPRFSLAGDGAQHFDIHRETGAVTTRIRLDRETKPFYNLIAYAEDSESGEACRVDLKITVADENDSEPRFSEDLYIVTVKEDAPVGALIGKVHADDADAGINRRVRYSLVSVVSSTSGASVIDDQFSLDSNSGVISLLRPLDRELVPGYNLTLQATDGGIPPQSSVVDVSIMVADVNDNPPEFAFNYYSATISELAPISTEVARILATSKDIGINADITYDIVGGNGYSHFGIHPKSGVIFVSAGLDYERIREYVLSVRARDGGSPPLASQALVNISLIDQNDNAPQFSGGGAGYSVQIPEDAPIATSVIQIQAADLDSGVNSRISYQLGTGDRMKHFKIDAHNGIVSVASALDREMISHYSLEVWAVDAGTPPLSSSTHVEIYVLDCNDSPPLIRVPTDELIVQEDRPIGYTIHKFVVSDADAAPNSEPFSWDLRDAERRSSSTSGSSSSLPFTVSESGMLNVAGKLNSQRKPVYRLLLRVFDNGDPPLYSDANITVKVVDKSQWPPVVSTLTVTAITADETYPAGIPLGKVHASDFDPYDILLYSLVDTPSSTHFMIDAANGTLKSLTPLKSGTYELGVTVSDGRWTARGDAYIRVVTLASLIPDMKLDGDHGGKTDGENWKSTSTSTTTSFKKKSRKDISAFAVVLTLKGHNPQSLLTRIFALINAIKESMGLEPNGVSIYDVVILSVQSSKRAEDYSSSPSAATSGVRRVRRGDDENANNNTMSDAIISDTIPSVDILLSVRKSTDGSFVNPSELMKKLKFALPQIESVMSAKVTRLTFDVCKENSCDRGQCRTVATFEGTQSLISTETLSLITPNHLLEVVCFCPPGFGGPRCEKVINACAHSECMAGYVCLPDSSPKGYACLCRKIYCPPGGMCEEDDHCAQQSVSFSGRSFLAYNVGPSLERELSISIKIKTLYTAGTILHSFGHFDYALLEIRQGLVQFSWDLGTGKEVLTVTSISVSDNRWHRIILHLRDNRAVLSVDERSRAGSARSPGAARSLHTGGILYIGAKIIGLHGSTLESLIPAQGFIGCMKDLRYGYLHHQTGPGSSSDLHIQEVKHYITPGINRIDLDGIDKNLDLEDVDDTDQDNFDQDVNSKNKNDNAGGISGRMAPLPFHSSDSDRMGSHLLWSRNVSFSCERILHVVEACRSQPCLNGGSCSEDRLSTPTSSGAGTGFRCDCPSRFHGHNCEHDLDPCGSQPCLNGGTCTPTATESTSDRGNGASFSPSLVSSSGAGGEWLSEPQFLCLCPPGTFGSRCERGRWCKNSEMGGTDSLSTADLVRLSSDSGVGGGDDGREEVCKHHGECEDGPSGPICWCAGGYTGATCQLDINECERGDACGPASTCINFAGGFRCLCPANATGLRCNRILTAPSIIVSDYQDLILIVVFVIVTSVTFIVAFILVRRCCIARERGGQSNGIALTATRGLKDNGHTKDNRDRDTSNREAQQLLRNRDSKISNLEVRPVSATSDLFTGELEPENNKPGTFINNLMKGSSTSGGGMMMTPMKDKGCSTLTHWDPNRDDYDNKVQNYMKGDLNWAPRPNATGTSSKPGSPVSDGYHWDHSDLTQQPHNISPTNTLPPPPADIPDIRISNGGHHRHHLHKNPPSNNLDLPSSSSTPGGPVTINLAALPPPHETSLPYFDDAVIGTSLDDVTPEEELPGNRSPRNWQILHPDQYLLPHTQSGGDDVYDPSTGLCSCPQLRSEVEQHVPPPAPVAIRNRYKDKTPSKGNSKAKLLKEQQQQHEDDENSSLLLNGSGNNPSITSSSSSSKLSSKIPRRQNLTGQQPQQSPNSNNSSSNAKTTATHVTQV
ncbi:fat-like cadherin-related tumor suppressor homolog isoform X3 [Folsomia candida]|uniref:fat-like cadherin-related tumor suppressor homolog isoform X3 n=1 Tax=Folsomia candida TaxID=158441 RepID=UPI0016052338|nr:fat-like cadherin-related tumor suppressor homolog isoform X3 [Folsomia candida]